MQSFVEGEGDRRWLEVVRALGESFQFLFNIDCDTGVAVAYRAETAVSERGGARADWSLYPAGILPPCFYAA